MEDEKEFVTENFPPIPAYDLVMYDIPEYRQGVNIVQINTMLMRNGV